LRLAFALASLAARDTRFVTLVTFLDVASCNGDEATRETKHQRKRAELRRYFILKLGRIRGQKFRDDKLCEITLGSGIKR
jgi:hypothetical protein